MGKDDWTQHNPWRSPGNAPVFDACGMAGGSPQWVPTGLSFYDTVFAKQGDLGSQTLPYTPTGVSWRIGDTVEAKWSNRADHGGGYQYRLCPLSSNMSQPGLGLTEACFQERPMPFAGRTQLEFGNGSRIEIVNPRFLSHGTTPKGKHDAETKYHWLRSLSKAIMLSCYANANSFFFSNEAFSKYIELLCIITLHFFTIQMYCA
jgi:hypothetical protein